MAIEQGDLGTVLVGSDVVGQITAATLRAGNRTRDVTVAGGGQAAYGPTVPESAGTIECIVDRADAGQTGLAEGAVVTLQIRPQGTGSGLPQLEIAGAVVQQLEERFIDPNEYNRVTFSWQGGAVNRTAQT